MAFSFLGSGGSPDRSYLRDYRTTRGNLLNTAGDYAALQGQAAGNRARFRPRLDSATADYAATLESDPFTDQYRTSRIGQATAGTNTAYERAKAELARAMGQTNLSVDSTPIAGAATGIEAGRAGALSDAGAMVQREAIADRERRGREAFSLWNGLENQDYGRETNALGAQTGIQGNLMNNDAQMWQQEQQRAAQENSEFLNTLGGIAGTVGSAWSGGAFNGVGDWLSGRFKGIGNRFRPKRFSGGGGDNFNPGESYTFGEPVSAPGLFG